MNMIITIYLEFGIYCAEKANSYSGDVAIERARNAKIGPCGRLLKKAIFAILEKLAKFRRKIMGLPEEVGPKTEEFLLRACQCRGRQCGFAAG